MRAIVTGGAGFIGSRLCEMLAARGHHVVCVDDFSTGRRENVRALLRHPRFRLVRGAVGDRALAAAFRPRPDWVFHWAATVGVQRTLENGPRVLADAAHLPRILEHARRADVTRFLYASSSEVYGDGPPLPFREDGPVNPGLPYAAAKLLGEKALEVWHERYGLSTTALRLFNVYGPRQDASPYGFVVAVFLRQALRGEPLTVFGDGRQTRDYTFVDDNVKATLLLAASRRSAGRVVNVGTGRATSVLALAGAVLRTTGRKRPGGIRHLPPRPRDVRHRVASVERLRHVAGYVPDTPLSEGLRRTLASPAAPRRPRA